MLQRHPVVTTKTHNFMLPNLEGDTVIILSAVKAVTNGTCITYAANAVIMSYTTVNYTTAFLNKLSGEDALNELRVTFCKTLKYSRLM